MARVEATIEDLGEGQHDGELALLRTESEQFRLTWDDEAGVWIGDTQQTIVFSELDPMSCVQAAGWRYLSQPTAPSSRAYSWDPIAVQHADEAFAAGLLLEEKIDADFWGWDADGDYELAVVYYSFDVGDSIDPLITPDEASPGRNLGTSLHSTPTVRCMSTTGWVEAPIDAPPAPNLAPHFYTKRIAAGGTDGGARIERAAAYIRWVGTPA